MTRDYQFVENFQPDKIFEVPPNPLHPLGYNWAIGEPVETVPASECDYLRDHDMCVTVDAFGVQRAYPWYMIKSHSIADFVGDVPVAVFF
jgi:hypothetical protein